MLEDKLACVGSYPKMLGCRQNHCIEGWCHWECFLQEEMKIFVLIILSLLTSSSLYIQHQDWHCDSHTAEKQHQQNSEILRIIANFLFQSIDIHTSPIKHLLPRQEPKHPRKLMRTVRNRNIKRRVTGIRKMSPLWSKRTLSIFDETFVKITKIKRTNVML